MRNWSRYPQLTVPNVYTGQIGDIFSAVACIPFDKCGDTGCATMRPVVTAWNWEAFNPVLNEGQLNVFEYVPDEGRAEVSFADARDSWRTLETLKASPIDSTVAAVASSVLTKPRIAVSSFGAKQIAEGSGVLLKDYGADTVVPAFSLYGADSGTAYMWFVARFVIQNGPRPVIPTMRANAWVGWQRDPGEILS